VACGVANSKAGTNPNREHQRAARSGQQAQESVPATEGWLTERRPWHERVRRPGVARSTCKATSCLIPRRSAVRSARRPGHCRTNEVERKLGHPRLRAVRVVPAFELAAVQATSKDLSEKSLT
jgi:hypothetical protein